MMCSYLNVHFQGQRVKESGFYILHKDFVEKPLSKVSYKVPVELYVKKYKNTMRIHLI